MLRGRPNSAYVYPCGSMCQKRQKPLSGAGLHRFGKRQKATLSDTLEKAVNPHLAWLSDVSDGSKGGIRECTKKREAKRRM